MAFAGAPKVQKDDVFWEVPHLAVPCRFLAGSLPVAWRLFAGCWPRFVETYAKMTFAGAPKGQEEDVIWEVPHLAVP